MGKKARTRTRRRTRTRWFVGTAVAAGILAGLAFNSQPANATPTRVTYSYAVTDSESTSVDLNIYYSDNLDYELDHLDYDPDTNGPGCEQLALTHTDGYVYKWIECYGIPASEAPEWVLQAAPGTGVTEHRYVWS